MKKEIVQKILNQTVSIYDAIASDFSDTRGRWWRGFGSFSKYVKAGDTVLDLGCGNGRMAETFNDSQVEYLGVDNSVELINIARARFKDKPWIKFEVGDSLKINYNNQFDLVLMIAVLHHLPTKKMRLQILKNIYSALKPGGRLVISNWNLWQVFGEKKRFRYYKYLFNYQEKINQGVFGLSDAFVPWKPLSKNNLRFIHSFRAGELKKLLKQAGFTIEKINFEDKSGQSVSILKGVNLLAVAIKK